MRKIVASVVTTGLLAGGAVGCASVERESQPTTTLNARPTTTEAEAPTTINKEMVEQHHNRAIGMRERRLGQLTTELTAGTARVSYDQGNCITFALPEGDVIVRNPAKLSTSEKEASIDFYVYTKAGTSEPLVAGGPYTYYHNSLGAPLSDAEVWPMEEVSNPELVPVNGTETDGRTSWVVARNTEGQPVARISETIIVPFAADGTSDYDALTVASSQLCGEPAGLIPQTQQS